SRARRYPPSPTTRARTISRAERALGQLALDPHRGQADARQPPLALEDEVARLPARVELRVEAIQALDLEVRVREPGQAADQPLRRVPRPVYEAREGGEVERDLLDTRIPQLLDRPHHQELHQTVRRLAVPPHARKGHGRPAVRRHEVEEATHGAFAVARDDDPAVAVVLAAKRVHRHRKAALR